MSMLEDGVYDALVVDANDDVDGALQLELAIVRGPHKGEVVAVRWQHERPRSSIDVLGLPATLTVTDGAPRVELDR